MKTVLVTGATGGIGEVLARRFHEAGYRVIIHTVNNKERAEALKREFGREADVMQCDLTDANAVSDSLKVFKRIDVLVNNAGIKRDGAIESMREVDFKAVMDTNVFGPWVLIKHVVPLMKAGGFGRIINITSGVAKEGRKEQANYAASKAALENMTRTFAQEFGPFGITVNAVAPGLIETAMTQYVTKDAKAAYVERVPLGRLVKAEDVAHACLFFASDDAGMISAQILGVNGGIR